MMLKLPLNGMPWGKSYVGSRCVCVRVCACSNICKIFTYLPKPIKRPPGNQHTNNNNNIQRQDSTFFFSIQLNSHLKTIVIDKHFTSFWTSFYVRVTFVYRDEECRHTHWLGRVPVFFFLLFQQKSLLFTRCCCCCCSICNSCHTTTHVIKVIGEIF